jgi:cytochrome b561
MKKHLEKHSHKIRNVMHWLIFLAASFAFAASIADVSAQYTMDVILKYPEIAENSILVKSGYLPF